MRVTRVRCRSCSPRQTSPVDATAGATASLVGRSDSNRWPDSSARSARRSAQSSRVPSSVTKSESPATASRARLRADLDRIADRPQRARVKMHDAAAERSANQTLPPATTIPTGKPPTRTRVIAPVVGSIRSTSPASDAVTQRYPSPAASPCVRPLESANGAADGASVEASSRSSLPGRTSSAHRRVPARTTCSTGPVELASIRVSQVRFARARARRRSRQSSATSRREPSPLPPAGSTEAMSLPPTRASEETSPPTCTLCATAPVASARREERPIAGRPSRVAPEATQSASGPAATGPGCPGTRSVAVTPRVVTVSPESCVASRSDPASAATTEPVMTEMRNRRRLELRADVKALFTCRSCHRGKRVPAAWAASGEAAHAFAVSGCQLRMSLLTPAR